MEFEEDGERWEVGLAKKTKKEVVNLESVLWYCWVALRGAADKKRKVAVLEVFKFTRDKFEQSKEKIVSKLW